MASVEELRKEYQQLIQNSTPKPTVTNQQEADIRNEYRQLTQQQPVQQVVEPVQTAHSIRKTHTNRTQPVTASTTAKTQPVQKIYTQDEINQLAQANNINLNNTASQPTLQFVTDAKRNEDLKKLGIDIFAEGDITPQLANVNNNIILPSQIVSGATPAKTKETVRKMEAAENEREQGKQEAVKNFDYNNITPERYAELKEEYQKAKQNNNWKKQGEYSQSLSMFKNAYKDQYQGGEKNYDIQSIGEHVKGAAEDLNKIIQRVNNGERGEKIAAEYDQARKYYEDSLKTYNEALAYDEIIDTNMLKDIGASFGKNVLGGTAEGINATYAGGSKLSGLDATSINPDGLLEANSGKFNMADSLQLLNRFTPIGILQQATGIGEGAVMSYARLQALAQIHPENIRLQNLVNEIGTQTYKGTKEQLTNELDAIQKEIYQDFKDRYTQDELNAVADQLRHNETYGDWASLPNAFGTVGNMVPSMLVGYATGGLGELAGGGKITKGLNFIPNNGAMNTAGTLANTAQQIGSFTTLGLGAAGQGIDQALQNGGTWNQALGYGALSGATEVGTEMLGGETVNRFLGQTGKSALGKVFGKAIDNLNIESKVGRIVANTLSDVAGESTEEMISEALNPLWRAITYDPNALPQNADEMGEYIKNILKAGAEAIPSTLLMQGAGVAGNVVKTQQVENGIIKSINESDLSPIVKNQLINEVRKASTDVKLGLEEADYMKDRAYEKGFNLAAQSEQMKQRIPEGYSLPQSTIDILAYTENNRPGLNIAFDTNIQGNGTFVENPDGTRTITLNPNSKRAVEFTLTHELGHDLKGTGEYTQLQNLLTDYAKGKPGYQNALNQLDKTYKESGANYNLQDEATNDMLGQAIGEQEFYNKLAENPTLFNRVTNGLKNLLGNKDTKLKNKIEKLTRNALKQEYKGNDNQVRSSLSEAPTQDNQGRELNKDQQEFNRGNKVVDENGDLLQLYHGTNTGEFTIFDLDRANPESDWGAGIYLTNSPGDVEANYTGGGPDWENKVARLAERIEAETDVSYEDAEKLARQQMEKGAYQIEAYAKMTNPAIVGETNLFEVDDGDLDVDESDYDNEDDYYQELEYARDDALNNMIEDALSEVRQKYGDEYDSQISNIIYEMAYEGGIGLQELKDRLGEELIDAADDEGNLISNEIARLIIQSQGYDGIIDNTVSGKWNMNLSPDTTHFIVFKPNQVKSVNNLHPTENVDINLSKSNQSWQQFLDKNLNLAKGTKTNFEGLPSNEELTKAETKAIENEPVVKLTESEDDTLFSLSEEEQREVNNYIENLTNDDSIPDNVKNDLIDRLNNVDNYNDFKELVKEVRRYNVSKFTQDRKSAEGTRGQTIKGKDIREAIDRNVGIKKGNRKVIQDTIKSMNKDMIEGNLTDSKIDEYVEQLGNTMKSYASEFYEQYKGLKDYLRKTKIYVAPEIKRGITDYNDFRKANMGNLTLTSDSNNLSPDQVYKELQERYGDLLPDDIINPIDQLEKLAEISSKIKVEEGNLRDMLEKQYGRDSWEEASKPLKQEIKELRDAPKVEQQEDLDLTDPNEKKRSWTETSKANELVREFLDVKDATYVPASNKKQLNYAKSQVDRMGYDEAIKYMDGKINLNERFKAEDIAMGEYLIQEAIKKGDYEKAQDMIQNVAIIGTELGQAVQAMSMIARMTPEGQLKYLNKVINRLNENIDKKNQKRTEDKQIDPIKLEKEFATDILKATDDVELQQAMDRALQRLADQMPVSIGDKIAEWRYLAMLANPRTHIRNMVANVGMKAAYGAKNQIQRAIETIAKPVERSRTFKKATEDVKNFTNRTAKELDSVLAQTDNKTIEGRIKEMRKIFKFAPLEKLRRLNSNALSWEDNVFTRRAFKNNLNEYLTANGIKTQQDIDLNPEIVQKGINFAKEEAWKTTFHQASKFATELNRIENINGFSKLIVGGTVPFKKTPINIAKTGASYSPLGLLETLTNETVKLRKGDIDASQYIDRLSQGLTGTALFGLGAFLSKLGILKAGTDDEDEYAEAIGQTMKYSLRFGDTNYDISWAAPSAMPLLMGAELMDATKGKEVTFGDIAETLASSINPLSEMSFVSGLNSTIKSYSNSDSPVDAIGAAVKNSLNSYFGQFTPTIGGQINKIIDDTERSTTASKNSKWREGESFARQQLNKIPGASFLLEPKTDIWGSEKKRDSNPAVRAFEALINPGTITRDKTTKVDEELLSLFSEVGDKDVKPKVPSSYFNQNNFKYEMSAKEYTKFKKDYGQKAYNDIAALIDGADYKKANSAEKAEMIKDIYTQAKDYAREEYGINPEDLTEKYGEREAAQRLLDKKLYEKWWKVGDVGLDNFWNAYNAQKEATADKYSNGKTIPLSKSENQKKAIDKAVNQDELNERQMKSLYEIFNISNKVY